MYIYLYGTAVRSGYNKTKHERIITQQSKTEKIIKKQHKNYRNNSQEMFTQNEKDKNLARLLPFSYLAHCFILMTSLKFLVENRSKQ